MRTILAAIVVCSAMSTLSATASAEVRTWRSFNGMFETVAELIELVDSNTVRLRTPVGQEFTVKIDQLSLADRNYISTFAQTNSTRPSNAPKTAAALEILAKSCTSAAESLVFYEAFFTDPTVLSSEKEAARLKLQGWQSLSARDAIRAGLAWISAEDAEMKNETATSEIRQGLEFLRLNNGDLAKECFLRASKADAGSNDADFIMGLCYAMAVRDLNRAETHFRECVKRDPHDVPALNNLSLVELKQRNYQGSVEYLRDASMLSPRTAYLSQNVGRLVDQAGKRRVTVAPAMQTEVGKLYSTLVGLGGSPFESTKGWLYMLPRRRVNRTDEERLQSPAETLVTVGGTGIIVAPGHVLTLRSSLGHSFACEISIKGTDGRDVLVPAKIVDTPSDHPLALLSCSQIEGPAVAFDPAPLRTAVDLAIFGYATLLEQSLEATSAKGRLLATTTSEGGLAGYDLEKEVSLRGGPVCNMQANVVAVHFNSYLNGKLGTGVTSETVVKFLQSHLPNYQAPPVSDRVVGWSGVDARIRASTVVVYRNEELMQPADLGITNAPQAGYLEDIGCMQCFGLGQIECPLRSCSRGTVKVTVTKNLGRDAITGKPIVLDTKTPVACDVCNGTGRVSCRACFGTGDDPELKR